MMVFKLKTGAFMRPVHISIAVHSRFLLLDFFKRRLSSICLRVSVIGREPTGITTGVDKQIATDCPRS